VRNCAFRWVRSHHPCGQFPAAVPDPCSQTREATRGPYVPEPLLALLPNSNGLSISPSQPVGSVCSSRELS
jgi:hypothetical protein